MWEKKKYVILSFHTTTEAMSFEKQSMASGIPGRLIPIPREITAGCGLAWRISPEGYAESRQKIQDLQMKYQDAVELML